MNYQGGKFRIAKQIVGAIERERESNYKNFVSLFCGACSIETLIDIPNKICNDKHPYLIAMWKALQEGWIPPEVITKEDYEYIRNHKDENPALTGFVGFGCSFGGKWFGGYAKNKRGDNYARAAQRGLLKQANSLSNITFTCLDYKEVIIPNNSIVLADPPYAQTTGYSLGEFDNDEFWDYMRELSQNNQVFICEQTAPNDFEVIWQQELKRCLDANKDNNFTITEKLFKYKK